MKTKKISFTAMFSIAIALIAVSCGDDEPNNPTPTELETKSVEFVDASTYGDVWTYYSLEENKIVQVDEASHKTDMTWDIAFNRYNIRTNSGLSGNGSGGAYDCGKVDLSSVKEVPQDAVFEVDTEWDILESIAMPPVYMTSTANPLLSEVLSSSGAMPPTYVSNDHIYIVKTASGKYAKLIIVSYYSGDTPPKSGFISFDYVIQKDGSKNF
jgi:hypothetical protein